MRVLTVSEMPSQHRFVAGALGPVYEFARAMNGRDALAMAEASDFDLVIADETTVPFGAFGLSRELKMMIDPPAVIVLLERPDDRWLARWSGADRWLVRPIDSFALADAAKALIHPSASISRRTD
ncbi:MAG TPA: hypothetical protein VGB64_01170 [Actinomycetota bacterium]